MTTVDSTCCIAISRLSADATQSKEPAPALRPYVGGSKRPSVVRYPEDLIVDSGAVDHLDADLVAGPR